jgi:hypothetical protein
MPVYEYKGQHYKLADGLSKEQALAKIKSHLGETIEQPVEATPDSQETVTAPSEPQMPKWGLERAKAKLEAEKTALAQRGRQVAAIARGAVINPALGVAQLATGGQSETVNQFIDQYYRDVTEADKRAGVESSLIPELFGSFISPVNRLIPGAGPGTSMLAATGRAGAQGAVAGALTPVKEADQSFVTEKALQVGGGAAVGAGLTGLTNAAVKFMGIIKDVPYTAQQKYDAAVRYLKSIGGSDDEVRTALAKADELVVGSKPTVAEAVAELPKGAKLAAEQLRLSSTKEGGVALLERTQEQAAARVRQLASIAGTEAQRNAVLARRDAVTGRLREKALTQADVAKEAVDPIEKKLSQQLRESVSIQKTTSPDEVYGSPRLEAIYKNLSTSLKKQQLDALEQNGVFPLKSDSIIADINTAIGKADNDQTKAVLSFVRDRIKEKTDTNGFIGSRDLYENVRKVANQDINKLLGQGEQFASGGIPQTAAKALSQTKAAIDNALNKSTNGVWGQYLSKFKDYSAKHDRMTVGAFLEDKLKTSLDREAAASFSTAVENAAATIKRATGMPRYEKLSQVMTPQEVQAINQVQADLIRRSKATELGGVIKGVEPEAGKKIPPMLSRPVALINDALDALKKGNKKAFNENLTNLMLDPKLTLKAITDLEAKDAAAKEKIMSLFGSGLMKNMNESNRNLFVKFFTVGASPSQE